MRPIPTFGLVRAAVAALSLAVVHGPAHGQCLESLGVQRGSASAVGDGMGEALSASATWMAAAAPYANGNQNRTGLVYMFRREGPRWVERQILSDPRGRENDRFGATVSVGPDRMLVGVPLIDLGATSTGAVVVYALSGQQWVFESIIRAPQPTEFSEFGEHVILDGDFAYIGTPSDDVIGTNFGSVYVFQRDGANWNHVDTLVNPEPEIHDLFGSSIALAGDLLIVGAAGDNGVGDRTGAAYIFRLIDGQWTLEARLAASDGGEFDWFGWTSAIGPDWALVGAFQHNEERGAAYFFHRDGENWVEHSKVVSTDPTRLDNFGEHVSLSGDLAIVAEPPNAINYSGRLFLYRLDGESWTLERELTDIDTGHDDNRFGASHWLDENSLFVKASKNIPFFRFDAVAMYDRNGRCGPVLSVTANCPSPEMVDVTVRWTGSTPNGRIAIIHAGERGFFYIPGNYACAGTWLGLTAQQATIAYQGTSGPNGGRVIDSRVSRLLCGTYIQLIDLETCLPSNVARLDRSYN